MPDILGALIEALPAYWYWVLGTAALFYCTMLFFGAHLSADSKRSLSLWLMGASEESWARNFCTFFDAVFGRQHLSVKCMIRSALASIASVILVYMLFGPVMGFLGHRTAADLDFLTLIATGMVINLIPDYLSLLETRWLLNKLGNMRSAAVQLGLLAVDLLVSALIIWVAIDIYQRVAQGEPASVVSTLALFSVLSVFFYTTFLTSAWAWFYCISTWVLRLFTKAGLNRVLDVEGSPVRQAALVGALTIVLAATAISPLVAPVSSRADTGKASRFDVWLCTRFPDEACEPLLRQIADVRTRIVTLIQVCNGRSQRFCTSKSNEVFLDNIEIAEELLARSCEDQVPASCTILGYYNMEGVGARASDARAVELLKAGCDLRDGRGCTNLGILHYEGRGVEQSSAKAMELFRLGCELGHERGCSNAGVLYDQAALGERDAAQAMVFYRMGCERGDQMVCYDLGRLYENGDAGDQDFSVAAELYERSCLQGAVGEGCASLAALYLSGDAGDRSPAEAYFLDFLACLYGSEDGCEGAELLAASGELTLLQAGEERSRARAQIRDMCREHRLGCPAGRH